MSSSFETEGHSRPPFPSDTPECLLDLLITSCNWSHAKLQVDNVQHFLTAANPVIRRKISLITQSGVLDNYTTEQIVGTA